MNRFVNFVCISAFFLFSSSIVFLIFLGCQSYVNEGRVKNELNEQYKVKIVKIEEWGKQDKQAGVFKPEQFHSFSEQASYRKGYFGE